MDGLSKESERLVKSFAARGRDGYQYARRAVEAAELFGQQKRTLAEAATNAEQAIRQGAGAFDTSQQEVQQMKQKLASLKIR